MEEIIAVVSFLIVLVAYPIIQKYHNSLYMSVVVVNGINKVVRSNIPKKTYLFTPVGMVIYTENNYLLKIITDDSLVVVNEIVGGINRSQMYLFDNSLYNYHRLNKEIDRRIRYKYYIFALLPTMIAFISILEVLSKYYGKK